MVNPTDFFSRRNFAFSPELRYRYKALDVDLQEIRLAKILPEQPRKGLRCALLHTQLDAALSYGALSYAWGDDSRGYTIWLNDRAFRVTENLYQALCGLRSSTCDLFWVDAICIDQTNISERNSQVLLMRKIFERARMVTVWLNRPEMSYFTAFRFAEKLATFYTSSGAITQRDLEEIVRVERYRDWTALYSLLSNRWWSRIWVVQEVAVSKRVIVMFHTSHPFYRTTFLFEQAEFRASTIFWQTLQRALIIAQSCSSERAKLWPDMNIGGLYGSELNVIDSFPDTSDGTGVPLLELLVSNKGKGATDPRDMVFALLGLSSDVHPHSSQPDYSKSLRQVYKETVQDVIARENNLAILAHAGLKNTTEFPTWVVDWRHTPGPISAPSILTLCRNNPRPPHGGDFNAAGTVPMSVCFKDNLECLQLRGCHVDRIGRVGGYIRSTNLKSNLDEANAMKTDFNGPYPTGEDKDTAFCQVMRIGFWSPDPLKPPDLGDEGLIWLQACVGRSFATTSHGYMAMVPYETKEDDSVLVFAGCPVPLIIRRVCDHMEVVGAAYGMFSVPMLGIA